MRPRIGFDVDRATTQLRHLITEADNVRSASVTADRARAGYLLWVHDVEHALHGLFTDVRLEKLHTARYWRIHSSPLSADDRPFELISDELELQTSWLRSIFDRLLDEASRAAHEGSAVAVPDTHALLHYRLFDEVRWTEIVSATPVRLVVPLRVVDELDAKKAARRRDLADRAAAVLAHLEEYVGSELGKPQPLREAVTIEVFRAFEIDVDPRRVADPDTEILETCEALALFGGEPVVLITGDYGMRLRATARDVAVARMPDELLIRAPTDAAGS
ncbi:MAG TPA: PIN domain-containing protein [Gaiellaceae bacterium]|nr:PIN domain-containing protein [Gaiellaceae bacterium]